MTKNRSSETHSRSDSQEIPHFLQRRPLKDLPLDTILSQSNHDLLAPYSPNICLNSILPSKLYAFLQHFYGWNWPKKNTEFPSRISTRSQWINLMRKSAWREFTVAEQRTCIFISTPFLCQRRTRASLNNCVSCVELYYRHNVTLKISRGLYVRARPAMLACRAVHPTGPN